MAKRTADTQLIKDGALSDGDGLSVGSQITGPKRATAAQMAARKLAKPRGGRRPVGPSQTRQSPHPAPGTNQESLFQANGSNNTNGAQQPQGRFSFSNGTQSSQPNQTTQSFPPFGAGSNNIFGSQFAAPSSSGFNFSTGQDQNISNPFAMPSQSERNSGEEYEKRLVETGKEKPLFAAHSPFHNGNNDSGSVPASQINPVTGFSAQAQGVDTAQPPSSLFSLPSAATPATASSIFTSQQPATSTGNLFAHLNQPQVQASNNIFGQGSSLFQKPPSTAPSSNLFAHLGTPQPSANFGQPSTSPVQRDESMMSTSPDHPPPSRPFGFLNGSNPDSQTSPSKNINTQGTGGSLFDRVSKPTTDSNTESHPAPSSDHPTQGEGGGLFGRITKPTTGLHLQASSSPTEQTSHQTGKSGNLPATTHPTMAESEQPLASQGMTSPFKFPHTSNPSGTSTSPLPTSEPGKKRLFGQTLPPQPAQSPFSPKPLFSSPVKFAESSQPSSGSDQVAASAAPNTSDDSRSMPTKKRKLGPPEPPADFTEEEKKQLITGWRLKCLDYNMRKKLSTKQPKEEMRLLKKFYAQKVESIRQADGGPLEELVPGRKRKAMDEQSQPKVPEKRGRFRSPPKASQETLPHDTDSGGSQTSSIFKNILGNKATGSKVMQSSPNPSNDTGTSMPLASQHQPTVQPTMPPPSRSTGWNPSKAFTPNVNHQTSSTASASSSIAPQTNHSFAAPSSSSSHLPSFGTSPRPNFFTAKPTASDTPSDTMNAPTLQKPTFGAGTSFTPTSSALFAAKPSTNQNDLADAAKGTSGIQVPTFGADTSSASNSSKPFAPKPLTNSAAMSSTPKARELKAPTFGASASSTSSSSNPFATKPSSTESTTSLSAPKAPEFKVPTFGAGTTPNFMAQFGQASANTEAELKNERKRKDYDSDEEDEAAWERKYEEEQRAKKLKYDEISKTKTKKVVNGKLEWVDASEDNLPNNHTPSDEPPAIPPSIFDQPRVPLTNGHNIFGHISGEESGAEGSKTGDADDEDEGQDERQDGEEEDQQHKNREDRGEEQEDERDDEYAPITRGRTPTRNAPSLGLFGRISRDEQGNLVREIPKPDTKSATQANNPSGHSYPAFGSSATTSGFATSNLFGQSTSGATGSQSNVFSASDKTDPTEKPSPSTSHNLFGKQPSPKSSSGTNKSDGSPTGDHTWKPDSPIRFGSHNNNPAVNVTSPSPSKQPLSGLFGSPKANATTESPSKPASSLFTTTPVKAPPSLGFNFTPANLAQKSLAPPSNNVSAATSRATSPGLTTGESANESNIDNEEGHAAKEEQLDLTSGGPGEEDEDVLFSVKAKALNLDPKDKKWVTKGVGPLRILKHRESGTTRMLMRQQPNGRIVLNASLLKYLSYDSTQLKAVSVPIANEAGRIENWTLRVGQDDDAKKLASILSENKPK